MDFGLPSAPKKRFFAASLFGIVACSLQPTAVVLGVGMDSQTRAATDRFLIRAERGNQKYFEQEYLFADGVIVPATLTFEKKESFEPSDVVRFTVEGRLGNQVTITRRAVLGFIEEKTKVLKMPLQYDCLNIDCPNINETCEAGKCVSADVDANSLPDYVSDTDVFSQLPGVGGQAGSAGHGGSSANGGSSGASATGGASGSAGSTCAANTAPSVSVSGPSQTSVDSSFSLSAQLDDDNPSGLTLLWTVDQSDGPQPNNPDSLVSTVDGTRCGSFVYTLTVTDSCGVQASDSVTVSILPDGGFVSNSTCNPSLECGSVNYPYCEIQSAITNTSDIQVNVAGSLLPYAPFVLRDGVSVRGGYTVDNIESPLEEAIPRIDLDPSVGATAISVPDGVNTTIARLGVHVIEPSDAPLQSISAIDINHAADVLLYSLTVVFENSVWVPDQIIGINVDGINTTQVTMTDISISGGVAEGVIEPYSAAIRTAGQSSASISGSITGPHNLGGNSLGIWHTSSEHLAVSNSVITGGAVGSTGIAIALQTEHNLGGTMTIDNSVFLGSAQTEPAFIQKGLLLQGGAGATINISNSTIEGGFSGQERVGVACTGPNLTINGGPSIMGSSKIGGSLTLGVYFAGPGATLQIGNVGLIQGGSPDFLQGGTSLAAGVHIESAQSAEVTTCGEVLACSLDGCADAPVDIAGIILTGATSATINNNTKISAGGCSSPPCTQSPRVGTLIRGLGTFATIGPNNTILGKESAAPPADRSIGVAIRDGAMVFVRENSNVSGGQAALEAIGVDVEGPNPPTVNISSNTIGGGEVLSDIGSRVAAILIKDAANTSEIRYNYLYPCMLPGSNTLAPECNVGDTSSGISIVGGNSLLVSSNMIFSGGGLHSYAAYVSGTLDNLSLEFIHNLCYAQGSNLGSSTSLLFSPDQNTPLAVFNNNIFFAGNNSSPRINVELLGVAVFDNNAFVQNTATGVFSGHFRDTQNPLAVSTAQEINVNGRVANIVIDSPFISVNEGQPWLGDFHIDPASCVPGSIAQAGTSANEILDIDGENRDILTPDIGPDECSVP